MNSEYKLQMYSPELLSQVVELLQTLWQGDYDTNLSYFRWKHLENPYIKDPLAIVALKDGKVAGFRSYFATKWAVDPGKSEFIMLSPGDTVVHPDHRRQGLSVFMGRLATNKFANIYKVYLNSSCNIASFPGYMKLGFSPIIPKIELTVYEKFSYKGYMYDFVNINLNKSKQIKAIKAYFFQKGFNNVRSSIIPIPSNYLGEFGNIVVSDTAKPNQMYQVVSRNVTTEPKIRLLQDEDFFQWRFQNPKKNYIFYYYKSKGELKGYVVLGASKNYSVGMILDYSSDDAVILEALLKFIIQSKKYYKVQIHNYGLRQNLMEVLANIGLTKQTISKQIAKVEKEAIPLLVRPVKGEPLENDWYINGLDVRDADNWDFTPICADGQ